MTTLHQFVPVLEPGGTGGHLLEIQRFCREQGWESEVFAGDVKAPYESIGRTFTDYGRRYPAKPGDILLYHLVIGSPVGDWVFDRPETLVINYQNITPANYYQFWLPEVVPGLAWGREQLRKTARRAVLGITVSEYNRAEMVTAGFAQTALAPILLDPREFAGTPDPAVLARLQADKANGGTDITFVGRVAPNKCHQDLIKAFAVYRRIYDPDARLRLVGGAGAPRYAEAVGKMVDDLDLRASVDLTGAVSPAALSAYYRSADVFLCLSEHEGFCVPLLEAWHHEIPVIALAAAAVPETLGDGGLLLADKHPLKVAAAIDRVRRDDALRAAMVARGRARLETFSLARTREQFARAIEPVVGR